MIDLQGYGGVLAQGTLMTLKLFVVSVLIGLILGVIGALFRLSKNRALSYLATAYVNLVRGIPEIVVILLVYYSGSALVRALLSIFGYTKYIEMSPFWVGAGALAIMFGAYASEVFRMAISELPKGQTEAAAAIGMGRGRTFFRVVLPQVWLLALPALGNLMLVLLKDTALVSVIGLKDIMFFAGRAGQTTQQPFTFYFVALLIYLLLTAVVMVLIDRGEYFANPAKRYQARIAKERR